MSIGRPLDSRVDQEEALGARLTDTDVRLSRLERQTDAKSIPEAIFTVDTFVNLPEPQEDMYGFVINEGAWYRGTAAGTWVGASSPIPDDDLFVVSGKLHAALYEDVTATAGSGSLIIGGSGGGGVYDQGSVMGLDGNEIQAYSNGAGSTLNLNIAAGGQVVVGSGGLRSNGTTQVNGTMDVNGGIDVSGSGHLYGNFQIGTSARYGIFHPGSSDMFRLVANDTGTAYMSFYNRDASGNLDRKGYVGNPTANSNTSTIYLVSDQGSVQVESWVFNGTTATTSGNLNCARVKTDGGSAASPSFYCGSDSNTGIYRVAENELGITTGGGLKATINSSGIVLASGDWFRAQGNTGWYNNTHKVGMYAVGADWITAYPSQSCGIIAEGFSYTGASGTGNYVVRNSTYGTFSYLSSTRDVKENVKTIDNEWAGDVLDRMRPVEFIYKWTGKGEEPEDAKAVRLGDTEYGFIAEEVAELDPEVKLTLWDADFNPNGWSHHNVVALLVASNKKTRERVSALEAENAGLKDRLAAIEAHLALN